jgi:signal transduction histidine kinase
MIMDSVLIVEDESIVAMELEEQIKGLGCGVMGPVSTAAAALGICETHLPDLVLMDIRIDGNQDGIEAAQTIQNRFGIPVIYLTAHADNDTMDRAKSTSPAGYLLKPVRPDELKAVVSIALHKSERERALQQQRSDFISMLTHDIRSPLQTVAGCAELLEDTVSEAGQEDSAELLRHIRDGVSHTNDMVSNFFNVMNFEFGRIDLAIAPLSLNQVLQRVTDRYRHEASRRELIVESRLSADLPLIEADHVILDRIISNLVINALKFAPPGGRVTMSSEHRGSYVAASVTNTGTTISSADMPHLFERGWRRAADSDKEGSGLGLYIVKTFVDMLHGSVEVESTAGSTRFSVLLPVM